MRKTKHNRVENEKGYSSETKKVRGQGTSQDPKDANELHDAGVAIGPGEKVPQEIWSAEGQHDTIQH